MVQLSRADPLARTRIKGASDSSDSAFYSVSFVIFCTFSSPINSGRNFPFCRNVAAKAANDSHGVNILFVKILPKRAKCTPIPSPVQKRQCKYIEILVVILWV